MTKMKLFLISALIVLALALTGCSTEDGMVDGNADATVPAQTLTPTSPVGNGILSTAVPTAESTVSPAATAPAETAPAETAPAL